MPGEGPGGTRTWIGLTGLTAEVSRTTPDTPVPPDLVLAAAQLGFPSQRGEILTKKIHVSYSAAADLCGMR